MDWMLPRKTPSHDPLMRCCTAWLSISALPTLPTLPALPARTLSALSA
jgi:hypothetical protein